MAKTDDYPTFEQGLQNQLSTDPDLRRTMFGKRMARVMNAPRGRKERVLGRMEEHARVHAGLKATGAVDWGAKAINWTDLMAFLAKILPLIMALFGL